MRHLPILACVSALGLPAAAAMAGPADPVPAKAHGKGASKGPGEAAGLHYALGTAGGRPVADSAKTVDRRHAPDRAGAGGGPAKRGTITGRVTNAQGQPETAAAVRAGGARPRKAVRRDDRNWTLATEVAFLSARPTAGAPGRVAGRLPRGRRVLVDHCEGGWCLLSWDGGGGWVDSTQAGMDGFWWPPLDRKR
jgi:hypothetical protein